MILGVIGVEINVNGWHFKLINLLTLTNLVYIFACLAKLHRLNTLHANEEESHHHHDVFHKAEYLKELFITYRNMLMNICSVVLILCLNFAT